MKKILLVLSLFVTMAVTIYAQTAPAAAKAAFAKAYPKATKVKWEKEDGKYEVSFANNGKEMSAIYTEKGALEETEYEMTVAELPAAVLSYMKEHYKGVTIKGAAKITKADGAVNYEAAVKGKDVLFDANGKFIKEAKD